MHLRKFSMLIAIVLVAQTAVAAEWYQGGTLHDSDLMRWREASYSNRLATAADWAYTVLKKKTGYLTPKQLRPFAEQLESCISGVAGEPGSEIVNLKTTETAGLCMALMGWG